MLPREPEKQVLEIKLGNSITEGIRIAEGKFYTLENRGYYTICPDSRFKGVDVKTLSEYVFDMMKH
jgi:hypothetical protein